MKVTLAVLILSVFSLGFLAGIKSPAGDRFEQQKINTPKVNTKSNREFVVVRGIATKVDENARIVTISPQSKYVNRRTREVSFTIPAGTPLLNEEYRSEGKINVLWIVRPGVQTYFPSLGDEVKILHPRGKPDEVRALIGAPPDPHKTDDLTEHVFGVEPTKKWGVVESLLPGSMIIRVPEDAEIGSTALVRVLIPEGAEVLSFTPVRSDGVTYTEKGPTVDTPDQLKVGDRVHLLVKRDPDAIRAVKIFRNSVMHATSL